MVRFKETLACFQMLAQLMKLPFRRDSIEKVLQDNLRRGLTPISSSVVSWRQALDCM